METVHRGNAAMKMSRIPGYAGGGLLDKLKSAVGMQTSKQVMDAKVAAEMKRRTEQEQQPATAAPTPAPTQAAPMGNQTIIDKRMAAAGAAQGAKIKPGMAKEAMGSYPAMGGKKKSDRGGMLKGPGTPTSDSIPAEVVDTGEPIKVATGERIVSKKQDAYLQKIAKDMGFPSVDAMLEAGTGEPVGPTLKYDDEMLRGAAGGASPDDLRKQLVSQIPTGGVPGAGPTAPSPQATPGAYDNTKSIARTAMSDVGAAINSGNVGRAINNGVRGMAATQVSGLVDTAGAVSGALKPVGNFISNVATGEDMAPAQAAAAQPATAPVARAIASAPAAMPVQPVAAASAVPTPAAPATVAATPSAAAQLGGLDGVNVGNGVTRFNTPGKSPLFTNMTDAAGMASNEALNNRGPVTAENRTAMQGIQGRQDAADSGRARMAQYNAEVTGAKAINDGQEAMQIQRLALQGNRGAQAILAGNKSDATTRRGQDITASGQAVQANAVKANQQLAQDRFGIEKSQEARNAAKADMDAKQQARLQAAFDAYDKEPSEDNAARVRVLTGKEKAPAPDLFDKVQTGVDPITNAPIYSLYNKRIGEMPGQQAKPQGQFEAGKVYTDAKGNRAMFDGKAFVPA